MLFTKKVEERIKAEVAEQLAHLREELEASYAAQRTEIEAGFKAAIEDHMEEERKRRYESEEPFVEIISERMSDDGTVEMKLDWNKAFIRQLRDKGFRAGSDDEYINLWLSSLGEQARRSIGQQSFAE